MNIYLFAHQDDEFFCIPLIKKDVAQGERSLIFYLTSGNGGKATPEQRNRESLKVLSELGVNKKNIIFLGTDYDVPDGRLYENVELIYERLKFHLNTQLENICNIYIPCYEGGHQDHDVISWMACRLRKLYSSSVYQFPLYNAYNTLTPFFGVMNLIESQTMSTLKMEFSFKDLLYLRFYKTQLKTWVGLAPFVFLRLLKSQYVNLIEFRESYLLSKPHDGTLLYERRTDKRYLQLKPLMKKFLGDGNQ